MERLKRLIEKTELYLYEPERLALAGRLAFLRGKAVDAKVNARSARKLAEEQKQYLLLRSSWYPLLSLLKDIEMDYTVLAIAPPGEISMEKMEKEIFIEVVREVREDWNHSIKNNNKRR